MSRFFEIFLFGVVAVGVHVAGFYSIPAKGIQAGGLGGTEAVSIHAASQTIETMVEQWEKPPSVEAKIKTQNKVSLNSDRALQIPVPISQTTTVTLPSLATPALPDIEQPPEVEIEPAKVQEVRKPKLRSKRKPIQKKKITKNKVLKSDRKRKASNESQGQKAKGNAISAFAGAGKAKVTRGVAKKQLASLQQVWGAKIRRRIERSKKYPRGTRKNGKATITLIIGSSGNLISYNLGRSSGTKALDTAALQAVNNTERFPAAPKELKAKSYKFSVPIVFKR